MPRAFSWHRWLIQQAHMGLPRILKLMLREHNCRPLLKHSRNKFVSVHPFSLYRDKKIALLHLSASMTAPVIVVSSCVSSPMYVPSQAFADICKVRFFMYLSDMLHLIFFQRYVNQMLTELIKAHTDNRCLLWQKTGRSHARQCVCLEAEHLIFVIEQKV